MAVPTISSISPTLGHTGGATLVEILGTGFSLDGMEVSFGGALGTKVAVATTGRAFMLSPISSLPVVKPDFGKGLVDVSLQNLDSNGDPVAGETVTAAAAYTYERVQLAKESDLTRLVRTAIRAFRLQVIDNVSNVTDVDYDSDPLDGLNLTDLGEFPAIVLVGPGLAENRFYSRNKPPTKPDTPGEFLVRRVPYTVDLEFGVLGISDSKLELVNLMAVTQLFFEKNKFLVMDRDGSDPGLGTVKYEMDLTPDGDLQAGGGGNNSNIRTFSGTFVLRGFDLEDLTGFSGAQTIGRTHETDDLGVNLIVEQFGS